MFAAIVAAINSAVFVSDKDYIGVSGMKKD
jgi:hypothetical protein